MQGEVQINQHMLTWAIARAGFKVDEFVARFPKVAAWLNDTKKPTIKQLEEFSHRVHVPFGYLLLDQPPTESINIPFFRTNMADIGRLNLNVYDTIISLQDRQEWLSDYLKDKDFDKLTFISKYDLNTSFDAIVNDIRSTLDLHESWACDFKKHEEALDCLTKAIESIGVIVVFNSIVENNTSRGIPVEECRGFVLVDDYAPFMFINSADGKAAQLFTMIHELAHLWIGESAAFDNSKLLPADDPIELLCDKVAAEFLVPTKAFKELWEHRQDLEYVARHFKVSKIVIARRALDLGVITRGEFFKFYEEYTQYIKYLKDKQTGGGDFYATAKKRISLSFAAHVNQAVKENLLLYKQAYKLTGLKGETYQKFISKQF